jgi:hypothetical protein
MITKIYKRRLIALSFIIYHLSFSMMFTSCSLDENPRDQIAEEEAFRTPEALFRNTVATLYNYIGGNDDGQGLQGTCRGIYDLQTFGSDEAMIPTRGNDWYDGEIWQDMYRHSWTPGHTMMKKSWLYLYKVITLCNHSIEQLDAHGHLLSVYELMAYKAEVRSIRAICYWYLLDLFARVPIITSTDKSINQIQQAERSQVFDFVVSELMESWPHLSSEISVHRGDFYARVTQSVDIFVLAKLMLNAEVYADDDWTDSDRPDGSKMMFNIDGQVMNAWEATIYYCNILDDEFGFRLADTYRENFAVHNDNSPENIWIIPMDKDLYYNEMQYMYRSWHYRHAAAYGFSGENGTCATLKALQVFGYGTEEQDERFNINYWADEVYDYDGDLVLDRTGNPLRYYPWEVQLYLGGSPYVETAGARMKKYEVDKNGTKDGQLIDNDIVLFRFADVLLMRAEAKLRNGEDGQDDLNAVRRRAWMSERQISLETLLDERLLELCWEGWRRQDLIRFGQYESLFQGDVYDEKVNESDHHTTVFPIPGDIITLNPNITQNKGY